MESASTERILLTVKDLRSRRGMGGIGHYYKALRPHLGERVTYFSIGKRDSSRGRRDDVRQGLADWFRFWRTLADPAITAVTLNPSLTRNCLLRDGVFLLLAKLRRKRVVVFFRGWNRRTEDSIEWRWRRLFLAVFGRADGVIVLSSGFKRKLLDWGYRGPIWTETTTVDNRLLEVAPSQPKSDAVTVLFLARLERDKGVYEAIAAHEELRQRFPNLRLTIVGEGSELNNLRRFVEEERIEGVTFRGYLEGEEKGKVFRESDLYLFPSRHGEGMPNSVLEAMAFGLPVITTAVGGLGEFFEDGKMGYLIDRLEPSLLIDAVAKLVSDADLRHAIGERNAAYAREHFMASTVAERLLGVLDEVSRPTSEQPDPAEVRTWQAAHQDFDLLSTMAAERNER